MTGYIINAASTILRKEIIALSRDLRTQGNQIILLNYFFSGFGAETTKRDNPVELILSSFQ